MRKIRLERAIKLLDDLEASNTGTIFSMKIITRTSGEVREMLGRFGVKKYLTGKGAKYDPKNYSLRVVFDVQKGAYRSINLDGLLFLTLAGRTYEIIENSQKLLKDKVEQ